MGKQHKISINNMKKITVVIFLLMTGSSFSFAQIDSLNSISKDQKVYELSMFWKELSYNFANMDNCPGLDMDCLYRAYIPIVENTPNDFKYYLAMQQFAAHFNNGHVYCNCSPEILKIFLPHIIAPLLQTKYKNGKVYIVNIGTHYSDAVMPGDEIISINNMPVLDYFYQYQIPYISGSNEEAKLDEAMIDLFSYNATFALESDSAKLNMEVKTAHGMEKVKVPYDYFTPTKEEKEKQKKFKWVKEEKEKSTENLFVTSPQYDMAYLKLNACDSNLIKFFLQKHDTIRTYKNLIIDITDNPGGSSYPVCSMMQYLVPDHDIYTFGEMKAKVHNSAYKAWASIKLLFYDPKNVDEYYKTKYYPYYYGTAFEPMEKSKIPNTVSKKQRYKGNIYVITGSSTCSAAETLAFVIRQNQKAVLLGKKTIGATGQPLVIALPSVIKCFINSFKTFDIKGNDISSGVTPDIEYDFSSCNTPQDIIKQVYQMCKER